LTQEFQNILREHSSIMSYFRHNPVLLILFFLSCNLISNVHAGLEGMWKTEHPEMGSLYFRVKSDGSCSLFFSKGTQTPIFKGTWEESATGIEMKFEEGSHFSVGEMEPGLVDVRMTLSPDYGVKSGVIVAKGDLVSGDRIGSLIVDPKKKSEEDDRFGYFGAWEGILPSGQKVYWLIKEDRTAGMTYSITSPSSEAEQVVGFWKKDGEKLQLYWNDGSYTSIETNGRRIEQTSFPSGALLDSAKGQTCRILPISVKELPEDWSKAFNSDHATRMPIIVLRQLSQARSFFRGKWIIGKMQEGSQADFIRLRRGGKAQTNRFGGVKGEWRTGSDTVSIVWNNGLRETISSVGNQFTLGSFQSNQPSTARPMKIELIAPEDSDKMGYYLNRKRELLDPSHVMRSMQDQL
jgi:hypothetical protein